VAGKKVKKHNVIKPLMYIFCKRGKKRRKRTTQQNLFFFLQSLPIAFSFLPPDDPKFASVHHSNQRSTDKQKIMKNKQEHKTTNKQITLSSNIFSYTQQTNKQKHKRSGSNVLDARDYD